MIFLCHPVLFSVPSFLCGQLESESDDSGDKGEDRGGDVSLPPSPAQPQQLFVEYDHPAEDNSYAGRLTRGQAGRG